jgi:hypothetical protein
VSHQAKFGLCVVLGLIGFYFVMARISIELLVAGFLVVAVAVMFGHYFWARMHQAKNPLEEEIAAMTQKDKKDS